LRASAAAALTALFLLAACTSRSSAPTATPVPSPTAATATPLPSPSPGGHGSTDLGAAEFDAARAFAHVEALAEGIGPRPAGSEAEDEAARYLRDQLLGSGYEVDLQPFTFDVFADAGSTLDVLSPEGVPPPAVYPLEPSANGVAEGKLVDSGLGRPGDFREAVAGNVALIQRGELRFSQKVRNAEAAGAIGAVIYNNEPGLQRWALDGQSKVPVLGISQEDGGALLEKLAAGPVTVRVTVRTQTGERDSQNVVARPPEGGCRLVAGGHYDSVPAGPGANDNASGTATVVELARVMAADGEFDSVCFVLFGAEEVGLIGSARFVDTLTAAESETLEGMLNFDMVSVGRRWLWIGSPGLTDIAAAEAEERGLDYIVDSAPGGSDHSSFIAAGIPALFLHSFTSVIADDPNYHTAGDRAENVRATTMKEAGDVGLAVIETLLSGR
jgi:hypothetical protein